MSQCTTRNSIRAGTVDDNFTFLDNSGNSNPETQPPTHPPTPANMSTHFGLAHKGPEKQQQLQGQTMGTRSVQRFRLP